MAEAFAGFITGAMIAAVLSPIAALMLVRSEAQLAQRVAPEGTNVVALAFVIQISAFLLFTAAGMLLSLALHGIEERRPDSAIGSPTAVYTLLVVAFVAVITIPLLVLPARRFIVIAAVLSAAMYGWLMPWLARAA
jgi:hypothetical protein